MKIDTIMDKYIVHYAGTIPPIKEETTTQEKIMKRLSPAYVTPAVPALVEIVASFIEQEIEMKIDRDSVFIREEPEGTYVYGMLAQDFCSQGYQSENALLLNREDFEEYKAWREATPHMIHADWKSQLGIRVMLIDNSIEGE